jgi:choline dehydrogenase-like flavoprotein
VETFIGVSGNADGVWHVPDGKFQPAMELNCVEKLFTSKMAQTFPDRKVIAQRMANLTQPVQGRGVCQTRNLCHRGCPYGAYFSTNSSTLPAAFRTGNLTFSSNMIVNKVLYDERKGIATGVEVVNTETNEVTEFFSRIIFLNASTVATAQILLNSTSERFPNGLGNGSDQVGRNLMDHHKCMGISAKVDGLEEMYYKGRKPSGIQILRFRNINEQRKDYLRGYTFGGAANREGWASGIKTDLIGSDLKTAMAEPGSWNIGFTGFGECLPYSDNRVTLNKDKKDKWGRNSVTVDCEFKENEKAMQKDMAVAIGEMLEAADFKDIRIDARMSFPGNGNHEMGTVRMGKDPKTSVLNGFNQMHEVKNVFVTDGSFMTSGGNVNPSLTYMAFTARACAYAVQEMKKQNI